MRGSISSRGYASHGDMLRMGIDASHQGIALRAGIWATKGLGDLK